MSRSSSSEWSSRFTELARNVPWASDAMRGLIDDLACAMHFDVRVMLSGERGVGKTFVARMIHRGSRRGARPFVRVAASAMWESLHAAAGAPSPLQRHHAVLQRISTGTLLVADMDAIPVAAQRRVVEFIERAAARRGGVRLITAMGPDVYARVRAEAFDEHLFYRLNLIHLMIPPLRDRPEDIPLLFRGYLSHYTAGRAPELSMSACERLVAYSWPGNVKELKEVAMNVARANLRSPVVDEDLLPLPSDVAANLEP